MLACPPTVRDAPPTPLITMLTRPRLLASLAALSLLAPLAGGCSSDDASPASTTAGSTTESVPDTTSPTDPELQALMLASADLPAGFTDSAAVDDTITSFCAGEDATAGLQAASREVRGFTRSPGGASVIQLAFRFRDDGAERFVAQAGAILDRCSGVPDATGLAFEYEPLSPDVEAAAGGAAEAHVGRYGVNVGSGSISINLVVRRDGDVGQLVAVLGLDLARPELDALAQAAFTAVDAKLPR